MVHFWPPLGILNHKQETPHMTSLVTNIFFDIHAFGHREDNDIEFILICKHWFLVTEDRLHGALHGHQSLYISFSLPLLDPHPLTFSEIFGALKMLLKKKNSLRLGLSTNYCSTCLFKLRKL